MMSFAGDGTQPVRVESSIVQTLKLRGISLGSDRGASTITALTGRAGGTVDLRFLQRGPVGGALAIAKAMAMMGFDYDDDGDVEGWLREVDGCDAIVMVSMHGGGLPVAPGEEVAVVVMRRGRTVWAIAPSLAHGVAAALDDRAIAAIPDDCIGEIDFAQYFRCA